MQAELRTVWERYTYSGLFKREYRLQLAASQLTPKAKRRRLTARLGAPSLQDKHSFAPLEPRLSGVDAVDLGLHALKVMHEQLEMARHSSYTLTEDVEGAPGVARREGAPRVLGRPRLRPLRHRGAAQLAARLPARAAQQRPRPDAHRQPRWRRQSLQTHQGWARRPPTRLSL